MNVSKSMLWILVIFLISCDKKPNRNGMEIKVICKECVGKKIELSRHTIITQKEKKLYSAVFDPSGTTLIKLTNQDTITLSLTVSETDTTDKFITSIYLEPNTNINLKYEKGIQSFSGDLMAVNNYLTEIRALNVARRKRPDIWGNQKTRPKTLKDLQPYLVKSQIIGDSLDKIVSNDDNLTAYQKTFLHNINSSLNTYSKLFLETMRLIDMRQHLYDTDDEKLIISRQDSSVKAFFSTLTIEPNLLRYDGSFYNSMLNIVSRQRDISSIYYEIKYTSKQSLYDYIKKTVNSNFKQINYQDLVLASLLSSSELFGETNTDELDRLIAGFRKDYPSSKYLPELEEIFAEYQSLMPGSMMKDFYMNSINDKAVKLSDYKGKLLYVDIWATWCGPCVEEFPFSKKLSKKYANQKDLAFIYVSLDSSRDKWLKYLKDHPSLSGIHGNQPPVYGPPSEKTDSNDVMSLYKITGIPHYLLIGKDGRIISANAPRPSQLVEGTYLDSLLKL